MVNNLGLRSGRLIASLRSAVSDGSAGLSDVPELVKQVIRGGLWRDRVLEPTGERICFRNFPEFVAAPPLEGLGTDIKTLRRLCGNDAEALDLLDQAIEGKQDGSPDSEKGKKADPVIHVSYRGGNSKDYALRRLRKNRPDLHAKVISGELTPNKAMTEAGFRPRLISIPREPESGALSLARRLNRAEVVRFVNALLSTFGTRAGARHRR